MRIVVAGGTGLIGRGVVAALRRLDHDVVVASPSAGVDIVSGEGLDGSLAGADAIVDVSKPRTYDPSALEVYFTAAARNLSAQGLANGVKRYISLSAVGSAPDSTVPYYRAKADGEAVIRASGLPFTFIHSTQFFEFAGAIADQSQPAYRPRVPDALCQPAAAADVAAAVAGIALEDAHNDVIEIAGPDVLPLPEFVRRALVAHGDHREFEADRFAPYFGGRIRRDELLPASGARLMPTSLDQWLLSGSDPSASPSKPDSP